MANTTSESQDPRQFLTPMDEEHFHKNRRSAIDYYGEDYTDKLLKITGGRVINDYDKPRVSLIKKYRK